MMAGRADRRRRRRADAGSPEDVGDGGGDRRGEGGEGGGDSGPSGGIGFSAGTSCYIERCRKAGCIKSCRLEFFTSFRESSHVLRTRNLGLDLNEFV